MGGAMGGAVMERVLPAAVVARARAAAARAATRARRHGASNNCTAQLSGTRKMGRAPRTGQVAAARFSWTVPVAAQCGTAETPRDETSRNTLRNATKQPSDGKILENGEQNAA